MKSNKKQSNLGTDGSVDGPYTTISDIQPFDENQGLEDLIECILEDITLDIDIGDIILGGKFKNKRTVVKSKGKDKLGQPTINGKPFLKFRIEKTLPKDKQSKQTRDEKSKKVKKEQTMQQYAEDLFMIAFLKELKEV